MALIIADRVKETATTTGTGTFTLGGAVTGFRTFNAGIGTGNTTYYCIFLDGTNEFEVGLGTYTAPDQLARDTVLASSNSGSKVNFSQGIKSVFCTQPSSKAAYLDASGNLSITTSNITEGTNLYYTDARFDTRLATKDTADLSEGTNLYYTDARARAAISVSGNAIAYNSSTGVITANFEESPTFTGNVVVSGNLTVTGTTTWLDSTNTQISDKNIVLNYASGDSSANADGAGITIQDAVDASTDASLTWNATDDNFEISHGLDFGDNSKARFGAGNDLQIYSDGTHSYIEETNGSGNFFIKAESFNVGRQANSELYITAQPNGAVTLYHDNSAKLTTTSSGIDVTGTVVSDGLTVQGDAYFDTNNAGRALYITRYGTVTSESAALNVDDNDLILDSIQDEQYGGYVFKGTHNGTGTRTRLDIANNGDISFYDDTGSSQALFWDASASSLGIGTTSPSVPLHVAGGSSGTNQSLFRTSSGGGGGFQIVCSDLSVANPTWQLNTFFGEQLAFGDGTTEKMRLDSSGNVGIGTDSPLAKLESYVSGNFSTTYNDFSGDGLYIQTNGTAGVGEYTAGLSFSRTVANNARAAGIAGVQDGSDADQVGLAFFTHPSTGTAVALQESLRISSDGKVGIGTSSPVTPLHINSSTTESLIQMTNSSTGTTSSDGFRFGAIGTSVALINREAGAMTFSTSNAEKMRIDSSGNVGIGTSSPSSYWSQANSLVLDASGNTGLTIKSGTSGNGRVVFTDTTSTTAGLNDGGQIHYSHANDEMRFKTAGDDRMTIDSSGNLGIGTTSPSRTLDVRSAGIPANLQSTSTAGGLIDLKHAGTAASNAGAYNGIRFYNGDGFKMAMAHITEASGSGYLQFGTNWAADTGDVMAIHSSGNVGIGTTSPSRKLHINGGTANFVAKFESTDGVGGILVADNSTSVDLAVAAEGNNLSFYNNSERMRIDSSGRVLINTTSSLDNNALLHIKGFSSGHAGITMQDQDNTNAKTFFKQTGGATEIQTQNNTAHGVFKITGWNGTASAEFMRVDGSSGNVGIGTTSPSG
jgi:hypothetical protein